MFLFTGNLPKLSYSNADFTNFPWDTIPDPRSKGEERLFSFSENVLKLYQYTAMQNSKIFPGTTLWIFVLGGGKFVFVLQKCNKTLLQHCKIQKFSPGTILLTPVSGERKVCFHSPKLYQNSPTAMQNSKILSGTIPRTLVLGERKFVSVLRKSTKTL